ncbi:proline dehydrogenase [Coprinopsis sp. MPI-PUGE-AT-0042]|nr:proline dehydrogenase [Coprinopsis sp. MPI-PUGE-AT-0042]
MIFDNADSLPSPATPQKQPLKALARAYVVYSLCSIPALVDNAPSLLATLGQIPLVRNLVYAVVKVTFFEHFVGGETASATVPLLRALRAANKGALFAYSAEVDEQEALGSGHNPSSTDQLSNRSNHDPPHKRVVKEILTCIDVAAEFENSIRGASNALSPHLRNPSYLSGKNSASAAEAASSLEGRRTWVALKITAMLPDAHALVSLSKLITARREEMKGSHAGFGSRAQRHSTAVPSTVPKVEEIPFPGSAIPSDLDIVLSSGTSDVDLTPGEIHQLRELYEDLVDVCKRGQEKGVRIIIDAEHSWYQPALDAFTLVLMRQFNAVPQADSKNPAQMKPLIYGTYQAYLRRTPSQIAYHLQDAKRNHYALGVKLVRGAYHGYEIAAHEAVQKKGSLSISPDPLPPVWSEKRESDESYNGCVRRLIREVREDVQREEKEGRGQGVAVLFGTHNRESCELIVDELVENGLGEAVAGGTRVWVRPEVTERVTIAQLYGMCDDLTDGLVARIASDSPMVIKYLPYGGIKEVMPYLSRRAIENKSVLGNGAAAKERERAFKEIMNRLKEMASFA